MKILILLFCFISSFSYSQIVYFEVGDSLTVLAKSGLSLRDSFSLKSSKIVSVAFGEKVTILSQEYHGDYIDERHGSWIKVYYCGKTGYMFSSYLSYLRVPDTFKSQPSCFRYTHFEEILSLNVDSLVESGERSWKGFGEFGGQMVEWKLYKDGTLTQLLSSYENNDLIVETYNFTMYDLLNLLEYYIASLPEWCSSYKIEVKSGDTGNIESINCIGLWFKATASAGKVIIVSNLYNG